MLVDLKDGSCRECRGQLEIVGADDATMDVVPLSRTPSTMEESSTGHRSWPSWKGTAMDPEATLRELLEAMRARAWGKMPQNESW